MKDSLSDPWLVEYAEQQIGRTPQPRGLPFASTSSIPEDVSMVSAVDYAEVNGATNNDERFSQGLENLKLDSREATGDVNGESFVSLRLV